MFYVLSSMFYVQSSMFYVRFTQNDIILLVILNNVKDLLLNRAEADPSLSLRMTIRRRHHGIFIAMNHLNSMYKAGTFHHSPFTIHVFKPFTIHVFKPFTIHVFSPPTPDREYNHRHA